MMGECCGPGGSCACKTEPRQWGLNVYAEQSHHANLKWWQDPSRVRTPGGKLGTLTGGKSSSGRPWVQLDHGPTISCDEMALEPSGEKIDRNKAELLMLIVSEIAEAMEGVRKGLMDDKLPERTMEEVELADALIRIFDYAGAYGLDLEGAYREKMLYNLQRHDHTHEARRAEGGKRF